MTKLSRLMGLVLSGMSVKQVLDTFNDIKGNYKVVVKRDNELLDLSLELVKNDIQEVSSRLVEHNGKNIGYIDLEIFSFSSAKQFKEALDGMNFDSLIIDLRDNPGGEQINLLKIASLFLDKNKIVLKEQLRDKERIIYSKGNKTVDYPIVILVNHDSASCSEVLTLALKEGCNAKVIGTTTYGKGVGQVVKRTENYYYKVTNSKWTSSSGVSIDKIGIIPDYIVTNDGTEDKQLEKAIDYLTQ